MAEVVSGSGGGRAQPSLKLPPPPKLWRTGRRATRLTHGGRGVGRGQLAAGRRVLRQAGALPSFLKSERLSALEPWHDERVAVSRSETGAPETASGDGEDGENARADAPAGTAQRAVPTEPWLVLGWLLPRGAFDLEQRAGVDDGSANGGGFLVA